LRRLRKKIEQRLFRNVEMQHTSLIAAGNHGVPLKVKGFNYGTASGVAPQAWYNLFSLPPLSSILPFAKILHCRIDDLLLAIE
jgi:hypothetical protein